MRSGGRIWAFWHPFRAQKIKKKSKKNDKKGDLKKSSKDREKECVHCGKWHAAPDNECWKKEKKNEKGSKPAFKKQKETMFSAIQMAQVLEAIKKKDAKSSKKSSKKKKREVSFRAETTDDEGSSSGESKCEEKCEMKNSHKCNTESEYCFAIRRNGGRISSNRETTARRLTTEVVVEIASPRGQIHVLRTLLDTGTSKSIILSNYVTLSQISSSEKLGTTTWTTMGGEFTTNKMANVNFRIPEFSTSKSIVWPCHVDESRAPKNTPYDLILGLDFLSTLGFVLDFEKGKLRWGEVEVEMNEKGVIKDEYARETIHAMATSPSHLQEAEARQAKILDADYSKVEIDDYIESLDYLDQSQKGDLLRTLKKFPVLFGGGLGRLNIKPIHLEVKEGARPYHAKSFNIPKAYKPMTKKEIVQFEKLGIWKRVLSSAWTAGTFIQPKKTGDVRVLTDFRKLNEYLIRKPHPLPKISDLLQKLEGFRWATAIDLSMGYYHIPLDEYSQSLCGTVMPWGLYQYTVLPMGLSNAPDIFQSTMSRLLGDLEWCQVYIDDILITSSGSYEEHMERLAIVLDRLQEAGFRANVRKCFFAKDRVEYLGYEISRQGIHPQPKKVEAILKMQPPTTKRQLRRFLGMVNYYRDMWRRRSHILAPLTALCSKTVTWKWTDECSKSFESIKRVIARETSQILVRNSMFTQMLVTTS